MATPPAQSQEAAAGHGDTALMESMAERRRYRRQRMLKRVKIAFNEGLYGSVECTLRNKSDTGALLKLDGYFTLPENFKLMIDQQPPIEVRLVWQKGDLVGIAFGSGNR